MIIDRIRRLFGGSEGGESSCEKSLRLLHEYLDGELDDLTASEVAEHFRVCECCYPHLALEERFKERLRRAGETVCCPDEVKAGIRAALEGVPE